MPDTVVYAPYYMPTDHPKWSWSDDKLIAESFGYLKRINPALTDADRLASRAGRLRFAQPVCEPGFAARIPPIRTPIEVVDPRWGNFVTQIIAFIIVALVVVKPF